MELHESNKIIEHKEIILSSNIEVDNFYGIKTYEEEVDRRMFMLFSAYGIAMLMFPTKSEAIVPLIGRVLIQSFFYFVRKEAKQVLKGSVKQILKGSVKQIAKSYKKNVSREVFNVVHKYPSKTISQKRITKVEVSMDRNFVKAKDKPQKAKEIKEELEQKTKLSISKDGIYDILSHMDNKNLSNPIIWDRRGIAQNNDNEIFMNEMSIKIHNKASNYIERKIRFALLNEYGEKEVVKQLTLKASANEVGIFDISEYFQELPKVGSKHIDYDVLGGFNDVNIGAHSKNIFVTRLIS